MQLKPRLAEVAKCVEPADEVVDIGTDHAYLPVYLIKKGVCRRVIGVEKNQQNLEKAQKTVDLFQLRSKIELRKGDGFFALTEHDKVEEAVIAGLGGRTIGNILRSGAGKTQGLRRFVLQPMSDIYLLRRWLLTHGFRISDERLAREKNHFYVIITVQHGKQEISDPILLEVGPGLLKNRDPLLIPYLENEIARCQVINRSLEDAREAGSLKKRDYYLHKEARLKEVLSIVTAGSKIDGLDE